MTAPNAIPLIDTPGLTEKQREAVRYRDDDGMTWEKMAGVLGVDRHSAKARYDAARKKRDEFRGTAVRHLEEGTDVATACSMEQQLLDAAKAAGWSKALMKALRRRLDGEKMPGKVKTAGLAARLLEKSAMALEYIDEISLANASVQQISTAVKDCITQHLLLTGQPTSITSVEDRRTRAELGVAIVKEFAKRGVVFDLPKSQYEVVEEKTA